MGKLIYLMTSSLDGYVEGPDGRFAWSEPDAEVHRFFNELTRNTSALLYGRRIYELMTFWQTADQEPSAPDYIVEFARIWQAKPKIVFSTTLDSVGDNARLASGDIAAELAMIKQQHAGDLSVSGPALAAAFARLGLIDEFHVMVCPVLVGGGKPYFSQGLDLTRLRLLDHKTFSAGSVYLRYQRV